MLISNVQTMLLTNLASDAGLQSQWASLTPHHNLKPKNPSYGRRRLISTSRVPIGRPSAAKALRV